MSINKKILEPLIFKKVTDPWWQNLIHIIIFNDPRTNYRYTGDYALLKQVPKHKSLFNAPSHKGLPIGNLTSQLFANIYMNELDQYAKHVLKLKKYARYVDDIVVIGESGVELHQKYTLLEQFTQKHLDIQFHPKKKEINKIECGINFVGFIIKPWRKYIRRSTINNLHKKIILGENLLPVVNSYMGMLRHTNGYKERQKVKEMLPNENFDKKLTKIMKTGAVDDGLNYAQRLIEKINKNRTRN
jgi:hypothetical protein